MDLMGSSECLNFSCSFVSCETLISKSSHHNLAVHNYIATWYGSDHVSLVQFFHNWIGFRQLWWSTKVEIIGLLSPSRHGSPSGTFKVKWTCLIRQLHAPIGDHIQLTILILTPHLQYKFGPNRDKTQEVSKLFKWHLMVMVLMIDVFTYQFWAELQIKWKSNGCANTKKPSSSA